MDAALDLCHLKGNRGDHSAAHGDWRWLWCAGETLAVRDHPALARGIALLITTDANQ